VTVAGADGAPAHEYEFTPEDFAVETHEREGFKVEREGGLAVAIATALSPELLAEGLARELVHHIQNTRKAADFQIDDRIHLRVAGPAEVAEMLAVHGDWVMKETLALDLTTGADGAAASAAAPDGAYSEALKVNGLAVTVEVWKA
jgi:isoleucyl-tRNA synthetase